MKKFTRILAIVLALATIFSFAACSSKDGGEKKMKVGFIFLHDENSTYDKNFITAAEEACKELGVEIVKKTGIGETQACYDAAADLADQGCSIVFADSFGHESFMIQAAEKYPDVQFCHATGTQAHTKGLKNFHNAFASIYEGRYLAGIAAGMKLNAMIKEGKFEAKDAKIGYVGAFPYAEVKSGYTAFFLGVRSVCKEATMEVQFTGSWYDEAKEKEAATLLIGRGCKLISQHADSMGAPTACEKAGVPNVSYNGSTVSVGPNTYIISSRIDWAPYYVHAIQAVIDGKDIEADWTGTLATKSVVLADLNTNVAADGTQAAIDEAMKKLESGELHVFDVSTFTVSGENVTADMKIDAEGHLTSYMADVDNDANMEHDTEVVHDGYFAESEKRSAPYFDIAIDGIVRLDVNFGN